MENYTSTRLEWNRESLLCPEDLGDLHFPIFFLHFSFFENKFLIYLEPVELEFVFAGGFCPAGTENRGALLVVRPKETKSENVIGHVPRR